MKNSIVGLFLIFILALIVRFLYFPQNAYFGFDQARDAYASWEIINGHLKVTGPPTANGVINHGVLYYYFFSPIYLISGGNPAAISVFLRILNAVGVILLFLIISPMFGRKVAYIGAFLFAISYEQTQFSLFLNHPSLAVISILIFYLGLSIWIFRKKNWGLFLSLFGLGLSIQFEFVETQLIAVFILFLLVFRKYIPKLSFKGLSFVLASFLLPISSYIISEIKNNFITLRELPNLISNQSSDFNSSENIPIQILIIDRYIHDNIIAHPVIAAFLGLIFLVILIKLIFKKAYKDQVTFLALWFFGGLLVYFFTKDDAYFYSIATSVSVLIFTAFLISKVSSKSRLAASLLIFLILISNINLISKNNPLGPNQKINPQTGLLLEDQKKIIDFIYQSAEGQEFAVNALTMPYNVNTTWSYLFEWYGKNKYGYVPVWGGDSARGFPGNLKVETARSKLPAKRFLIIEPQEGIPSYLSDNFIKNEENYAKVMGKKKIGTMEVWVQQPK